MRNFLNLTCVKVATPSTGTAASHFDGYEIEGLVGTP